MGLVRAIRRFTTSFSTHNQVLEGVKKNLLQTIDIDEVVDIIFDAIRQSIQARKAVILLWDERFEGLVPIAMYGIRRFDISIPRNHPLSKVVYNSNAVLLRETVQSRKSVYDDEKKGVINAFNWLDAEVVLPLQGNNKFTGIILLGQKTNGEPYSKIDVNFLSKLGQVSSSVIENARMHRQSQELNVYLKREIEEATHELAQANTQLKNLDKAKSEFLSIASHQLYTPLTALRGYVSMLQDGDFGKVPKKQQPVLNILEKSATRLIELIKNLLDISRIESGRLELKLESVNLAEMAKELVADLMPNAMTKGLKLEFNSPAAPVRNVVVDQERLRQVMLNFIDNAIKYTTKGQIDVYVYERGNKIVFSVEDTGKGIKKEEIPQLFNKFTRVGGSSRFNTEGTGLGLYVARQIVREHHGEVQVDSPGEGKGSTFSLYMPVEGDDQSLKIGEHASVVIKAAEAQAVQK